MNLCFLNQFSKQGIPCRKISICTIDRGIFGSTGWNMREKDSWFWKTFYKLDHPFNIVSVITTPLFLCEKVMREMKTRDCNETCLGRLYGTHKGHINSRGS